MVAIDHRTKTMNDVALKCRALGHAMDEVAVPARIRAEHHARGQRLVRIECLREVDEQKCPRWREVITDMDTGEVIGQRGNYLDGGETYLVQGGGGRLPRAAARVAYYWRRGEVKGAGRTREARRKLA